MKEKKFTYHNSSNIFHLSHLLLPLVFAGLPGSIDWPHLHLKVLFHMSAQSQSPHISRVLMYFTFKTHSTQYHTIGLNKFSFDVEVHDTQYHTICLFWWISAGIFFSCTRPLGSTIIKDSTFGFVFIFNIRWLLLLSSALMIFF